MHWFQQCTLLKPPSKFKKRNAYDSFGFDIRFNKRVSIFSYITRTFHFQVLFRVSLFVEFQIFWAFWPFLLIGLFWRGWGVQNIFWICSCVLTTDLSCLLLILISFVKVQQLYIIFFFIFGLITRGGSRIFCGGAT